MTHQVPSTNRDLPRHGSGNPFGLFDYGLTADPYDLSNDSGDSAMMPSEDRPTTMSVDADLAVCGWCLDKGCNICQPTHTEIEEI